MKRPVRLAINGLGRIGRVFLRIAWNNPAFEIVGANSRSDLPTYAHLIKYDSIYGVWREEVSARGNKLVINGKAIPFYQEVEGDELPWKKFRADLVLDATGKFKKRAEAEAHIRAGAKYVVVTAPGHDLEATLIYGVNEKSFDPKAHHVISAASCTSICSALTVKVLDEVFSIERGFINTVHAFTSDQSLQDSSHKDPRRARAATQSIIPTSTGVTKTIDKFFPNLKAKISGLSLRVPVIDPSVLCLTAVLKKKTSAEEVNKAFTKASKGSLKDNLAVSDLPLVSRDYQGNPMGATIDMLSTEVVDGRLVNVVAWYDNEWGYVSQMTKLLEFIAGKI